MAVFGWTSLTIRLKQIRVLQESIIKKILLFCIGAVILCSGCGSLDRPSEQMASASLTRYGVGEGFTVLEFKKTNGQRSVINGVEHYEIMFAAKIKFVVDLMKIPGWPSSGYYWRAGETRQITGHCMYDMTDNGWRQIEVNCPLI